MFPLRLRANSYLQVSAKLKQVTHLQHTMTEQDKYCHLNCKNRKLARSNQTKARLKPIKGSFNSCSSMSGIQTYNVKM